MLKLDENALRPEAKVVKTRTTEKIYQLTTSRSDAEKVKETLRELGIDVFIVEA